MGTREARGAVQMLLEGRDERERRGVEVGWRATSEWCMKLARHEAPNHRMIQMFSFVHQVSRLAGHRGGTISQRTKMATGTKARRAKA